LVQVATAAAAMAAEPLLTEFQAQTVLVAAEAAVVTKQIMVELVVRVLSSFGIQCQ
jgi:hypothetical protein